MQYGIRHNYQFFTPLIDKTGLCIKSDRYFRPNAETFKLNFSTTLNLLIFPPNGKTLEHQQKAVRMDTLEWFSNFNFLCVLEKFLENVGMALFNKHSATINEFCEFKSNNYQEIS